MKQILCTLAIILAISLNAISQDASTNAQVTDLTIEVKGNNLLISWKAGEAVEKDNWQVQSSKDGLEFKTIGFVWGSLPGEKGGYEFKEKIVKGTEKKMYYRVLAMEDEIMGSASETVKL